IGTHYSFNSIIKYFKPVLANISIDFEIKSYNLLPLDNLLNYYEKLEEFINELNYTGDIEA
ncbi:14159_t:CDS:1, partial [Racocetra persica]